MGSTLSGASSSGRRSSGRRSDASSVQDDGGPELDLTPPLLTLTYAHHATKGTDITAELKDLRAVLVPDVVMEVKDFLLEPIAELASRRPRAEVTPATSLLTPRGGAGTGSGAGGSAAAEAAAAATAAAAAAAASAAAGENGETKCVWVDVTFFFFFFFLSLCCQVRPCAHG
jgi:hypothetical protein